VPVASRERVGRVRPLGQKVLRQREWRGQVRQQLGKRRGSVPGGSRRVVEPSALLPQDQCMADDETYRDLSSAPLPGDALPLAPLAPRPPAPWPVLPAALSRLKAWMVPLSLQTASHLTFAPPKATPPCRSTALSAPRRSSRSSAPDRPLKTRTSVPRAEVVVTSAPEGEHVSVERAVVCAMTICDRAGGRVAEVEDEAWAADGAGWTCRRWTCPAWRPGIASKDEPGSDATRLCDEARATVRRPSP
jgi:hypothetical protein